MPSQYTIAYLNENESRGGEGKGITPGTFLGGILKGTAKRWITGYRVALEKDLAARSDVVRGQSVNKATAYYWREEESTNADTK